MPFKTATVSVPEPPSIAQKSKMVSLGFKPLDREPTLAVKFFSAGLAGSFADILSFPLDTTKVRLQIQGEGATSQSALKYRGVIGTCRTVLAEEGLRGMYGGLVAGLHRQMILASIRVGLYKNVRDFYQGLLNGDPNKSSMLARIVAGFSTGAIGICFAQPSDVVKVRMQAQGALVAAGQKPRYTGTLSAYRNIAQVEGVAGLWKGILPNIARNALVNSAELVSYDCTKTFILKRGLMEDLMPCHFLSGLVASFVTTVVCSPVDVIKTRFMNSSKGQYKGAMHCATQMWQEKGVAAFYKGCVPLFTRLSVWNILLFVSFEQFQRGLTHLTGRSTDELSVKDLMGDAVQPMGDKQKAYK